MRSMFYQKKRIVIMAFLLCFFGFFLFFSLDLSAQTASELRDKIEEGNNEIGDLEEEIKKYQRELVEIGKEKRTLNNVIREIDVTRRKLNTDIKVTQGKISTTNLEIQGLELQIGDKGTIIGRSVEGLGESMRRINEFDSSSMVEMILSNDRISDIWKDIDELQSFQKKARDHVIELRAVRKGLRNDKDETEQAKQKLVNFKTDLSDQKKIVDQNKREKDNLLKETKNQESNYNKLIEEKLAKKKAFERSIEEYESQLKFILDPSLLPGKGSLIWPLDYVFITQRFGKTVSSKRLYASGSHSGVDFRASVGTKIKAMASGIVIGTGDTDKTCRNASWGKWVTIKYDNGLASTYGHLSLIKVTSGQRVSAGEMVGYSGNTGHSTAPHLHVTVYAGDAVQISQRPSKGCPGKTYTIPLAARNAYLDPFEYLPSTTSDMFKHKAITNQLRTLSRIIANLP